MLADELLSIAATWSFWDRALPASVSRNIALPARLSDTRCLVVQGVRRCGKSTLLRQLIPRYGLDPTCCAFLNFEDPRLTSALHYTTLEQLVEGFCARRPDARQLVFFLDEIQWVTGWERWLRVQLDQARGHTFVITGSNATLLSGELSTALTGRHLTVELFPFDLDELRRYRPETTLADYLQGGGFPEPVAAGEDSQRLLRQYFHDIVERDVRERVGARSSLSVRQVAHMAYESAGSEMSLRRIAAATGLAVDTVRTYLEACESAYLVLSVPYFAFSARQREARHKKYYPIDTGLRRAVVTRAGEDQGKALECAVQLALRRRFREVYYWRDGGEVDFVVQRAGRATPIQVTLDGPDERHHRALDAFYARHPHSTEAIFVTAADFAARLDELAAEA